MPNASCDGEALGSRPSSAISTCRGTTLPPRTSIGSVPARPRSVSKRILSRNTGFSDSWKLTSDAPKLSAKVACSEWIV